MINDFLIGGHHTHATEETYNVLRPKDGSVLTTLPSAGAADVEAAVSAARAAFADTWRFMDELERQALFFRWADLLDERADEIAAVVAEDSGTDLDGPKGTIGKISAMARYYAGFIVTNYGDVLSLGDDHMNFVVREPVGVVALMPPWNSPLEATMQKLGPALAAGKRSGPAGARGGSHGCTPGRPGGP